jgi:WD40 repeat protein
VRSKTLAATLGHSYYWVNSVAFSPDGLLLANGSDDGTVKLWDVRSKTLAATLEHSDWVYSVAFSPDGSLLASGGGYDETVKLWDVRSRTLVETLEGYSYGVWSVAFSLDGLVLASGGFDQVKLWDVRSMTLVETLEGHSYGVRSVAFSPDDSLLASGSSDGTIIFWDMKPYTKVSKDIIAPSFVNDLEFEQIDSSSINLNWTSSGDDKNKGKANIYDIRYSTEMITDANFNSATKVPNLPLPVLAGTQQTCILSGLSPDVIYYFAMKVADEMSNWSGLSNVICLTPTSISLGRKAYILNGLDETMSVFDIERSEIKNDTINVGKWSSDIKIFENKAYVVNVGDDNIQIINLATMTYGGIINIGANSGPQRIVFLNKDNVGKWSSDFNIFDNKAYVSCLYTNSVRVINLRKKQVIRDIPVGIGPVSLTIFEKKVYVCNSGYDFAENSYKKGTVSVIDSSSDTVTNTIEVGINPLEALTVGNKVIIMCAGNYANVMGKLCIIDSTFDTVIKTVDLGTFPSSIAISSNCLAYMTTFDGLISVDIKQGKMIHKVTNPLKDFAGGSELAFNKEGNCYICVPDWKDSGNDRLLIMDRFESLIGVYPLGSGASLIAISTEDCFPVSSYILLSTSPANGGTIAENGSVTMVFSESMKEVIVTGAIGTVSLGDGKNVVWTPTGDIPGDSVALTVNGSDMVGNKMAETIITLTVDRIPPEIWDDKSDPKNGATSIDAVKYSKLEIVFSESMSEVKVDSFEPNNAKLYEKYDDKDNSLIIQFLGGYKLSNGVKVKVVLSGKDGAGNDLKTNVYSFSTIDYIPANTSLVQLIQQQEKKSIEVTVDGVKYLIVTLNNNINPKTLEISSSSSEVKIYTDINRNPISDFEIVRKINVIDYARKESDQLNLKSSIETLNNLKKEYSNYDLKDMGIFAYEYLKAGAGDINNLLDGVKDSAEALTTLQKQKSYSKIIPTGLIVFLITELMKEKIWDPSSYTKAELLKKIDLSISSYNSAQKIKEKGVITNYEDANAFLWHCL